MRLPFLQVDAHLIEHGARVVAGLARCSVPEALGHVIMLRSWAVASPLGVGRIQGPMAAEIVEAAAHWRGEKGVLLNALLTTGDVLRDGDGYRVLRVDGQPDVAYPVLVRMKTPEERAEWDAQQEPVRRAQRDERARRVRAKEEAKAARLAAARVYFIQQDGGERLVKIGTTTRPVEVRLKEIQAGQAWPLVILAHAPGGRDQESHLHRRFGPHNVTGEWFRPEADLLAYVATVGKGGVL